MSEKSEKRKSPGTVQKKIFVVQTALTVVVALLLATVGIYLSIRSENEKRDGNLQNVAEAVAHSGFVADKISGRTADITEYIDVLKESLSDIDVISVVNTLNVRIYHSNHNLISTVYDGTLPDFEKTGGRSYSVYDRGPSGSQRRAYAAIYDENGDYCGFVMAVMLMNSIRRETLQILAAVITVTAAVVLAELFVSYKLSAKIKKYLMGYEPDAFSAMYKIRDSILESLEEGVVAVDRRSNTGFVNKAAADMLKIRDGQKEAEITAKLLSDTVANGENELNAYAGPDILIDKFPIKENGEVAGAVGILHNRAEYTKLIEDLSGTRYLVDSMRANNHDFTNKLHVILGLIQMQMYDEAVSYIQNITMVQRETISGIMNAVDEPTVAALLIGKVARASELNVKFVFREGCSYKKSDIHMPVEALVTVIGNLIDNAFDAMNNSAAGDSGQKELLFGIYSKTGALLITVDDTGTGIDEKCREHIFENGFSTKGTGRGTGLYQVKKLVEGLGGNITFESQSGSGTSFAVSFNAGYNR